MLCAGVSILFSIFRHRTFILKTLMRLLKVPFTLYIYILPQNCRLWENNPGRLQAVLRHIVIILEIKYFICKEEWEEIHLLTIRGVDPIIRHCIIQKYFNFSFKWLNPECYFWEVLLALCACAWPLQSVCLACFTYITPTMIIGSRECHQVCPL